MTTDKSPPCFENVEQLEEFLSRPTQRLVEMMSRLEGDLLILGVAGKMGPTLARMALRASQIAKTQRRVIGVSRFSNQGVQQTLESHGIETIRGDLLNRDFVASLPDARNIISMAGMKFGSTDNESLTWAMNTHLPSLICERFRSSRIVAFSTGNVYGLIPVNTTGSLESDVPKPVGEYAMSCLGRERIYQHFCQSLEIPTTLIRLNYAIETRYGVLVDLAQQVLDRKTIDLTMGFVNVIWQGDANAMSIRALEDTSIPATILNVAGAEKLSVKDIALQFGEAFNVGVKFAGTAANDALLNDGSRGHQLYGPPSASIEQMINWVANWVGRGFGTMGKKTHFDSRDGKF